MTRNPLRLAALALKVAMGLCLTMAAFAPERDPQRGMESDARPGRAAR